MTGRTDDERAEVRDSDRNETDSDWRELISFRSRDQRTISFLLACAACAIAISFVSRGGLRDGLVRIDAMAPLEYHPVIDLNDSGWPELCLLPGISRVLAQRIVADRQQFGPYTSVDQLTRVRGIGPASVARLRPWLFLGDELSPSAARERDRTVIGSLE